MHVSAKFVLALAAIVTSSSEVQAENWTLLIQPPPKSQNPPSYNYWLGYRTYGDLETCLGARMELHYGLWDSDQDLSMRALSGVCRSDSTGQIIDRVSTAEDDDEDW